MDLRRLEVLVTLAEEASFSRAARRLGVTQPAVSLAIRALETEIGVPLVVRKARRAELTAAGDVLLRYAQALTRMAREAGDAVRAAGTRPAGRINLGASSVPGNYLLPARLVKFRETYPEVRVIVEITDSSDQIERVIDHRVEMAVVGMRSPDRRLEFTRFAEDEVVLVAPPASVLDVPDTIARSDVARLPILSREAGSATRRVVEDEIGTGIEAPLVLGSLEAVKQAVSAGAGVAFLSRHSVEQDLARGLLREVHVTGLRLSRAFYVVRPKDRAPSPALAALQRFLLEEAGA